MDIDNIILFSIDDLRSDGISCEEDLSRLPDYCRKLSDTPNIDYFANQGVRFSHCVSTSSYTPASHASMLTGLYPHKHGVKTFFDQLNQVNTIANQLRNKGFGTFAQIEHLALKKLNITEGFNVIDERYNNENKVFSSKLSKHNFFFIHMMDVHAPYYFTTGSSNDLKKYNADFLKVMSAICNKNNIDFEKIISKIDFEARKSVKNFDSLSFSLQEWAKMRSLNYFLRKELQEKNMLFQEIIPLYLKGISKFDKNKFKDTITYLKKENILTEKTLLIITADHGEAACTWMGRTNFMNSFNVSEGAIRVPLIFYAPKTLPAGKIIKTPVSLIDIAPTIFNLLGLKHNKLDGINLFCSSKKLYDREIFSETHAYQGGIDQFGNIKSERESFMRQSCVKYNEYKYVKNGERPRFNNLSEDDEVFIKQLYRSVLGRFETSPELMYWLLKLKKGQINHKELYSCFLNSMMQKKLDRLFFLIKEDPLEKNNEIGNPKYASIIKRLQDRLEYFNTLPEKPRKFIKSDDDAMTDHLKILGYL